MKAMILAAGRGQRLGTLTNDRPKPMLPILHEPLIEHTVRYLAAHGCDEIAINLHYLGQAIENHLGDGSRFGVELRYFPESRLLGTAGAVRRVVHRLGWTQPILVIYGDLLIDQDLRPMLQAHRSTAAAATLLVHRRRGSNSLLQLAADHRITAFIERPTDEQRARTPYPWVNSGLQILSPPILEHLTPGRFADLPRDVYVPFVSRMRIYGFPLTGFRIAIDSPGRYAEAQAAAEDGRYRRPPTALIAGAVDQK